VAVWCCEDVAGVAGGKLANVHTHHVSLVRAMAVQLGGVNLVVEVIEEPRRVGERGLSRAREQDGRRPLL
jgi:hypothetical protein